MLLSSKCKSADEGTLASRSREAPAATLSTCCRASVRPRKCPHNHVPTHVFAEFVNDSSATHVTRREPIQTKQHVRDSDKPMLWALRRHHEQRNGPYVRCVSVTCFSRHVPTVPATRSGVN